MQIREAEGAQGRPWDQAEVAGSHPQQSRHAEDNAEESWRKAHRGGAIKVVSIGIGEAKHGFGLK
jgi:hypothetical protein